MIKLKFFNSLGEVLFDKDNWHIFEIDGLSLPTKQVTAVRYINQPGQTTTYSIENPRTITVSGDINLKNREYDAFSDASRVLAKDGVLEIETDAFIRQINARCIEFIPGEKRGAYRQFVVQFLCDSPFFEDIDYTETVIYERVPLLNKDTVLPAIFSSRTSKGDVFCRGTAFSEPKIYVSVPEGVGALIISNITTGSSICLEYDGSIFSELIIDVENRTITDENGISRLDILTDDSFFGGFLIESGVNRIEVINSDVSQAVEAKMEYKIRYQEAVL